MNTKRIACYARVSTQDQSTGMESQIRVLKTYCEQNGYQNAEFFTDEGISGTKSSRPALDRMMAAVDNDEISACVVYSFSRFARSTTHLLNALQIFKKKGVHFTSISEKIDTNTAIGVAIFSILASIAHYAKYGDMRSEQTDLEYYSTFNRRPTPHNYESIREAIKLSGALNRPRLSDGGTPQFQGSCRVS